MDAELRERILDAIAAGNGLYEHLRNRPTSLLPALRWRRARKQLTASIHAEMAASLDLGPTGEFPDGKLSDDDCGAVRMALVGDPLAGIVTLSFGTPMASIGMHPVEAEAMAESLVNCAKRARGENHGA